MYQVIMVQHFIVSQHLPIYPRRNERFGYVYICVVELWHELDKIPYQTLQDFGSASSLPRDLKNVRRASLGGIGSYGMY